jgi:hypothetical protein
MIAYRLHATIILLVLATGLIVLGAGVATSHAGLTQEPPDPAIRVDNVAERVLGDAFACVAAPPLAIGEVPAADKLRRFGLVLARRGDRRQRSRDHARAVRLLDHMGLTATVDLGWTSKRFRASSMVRIGRRLSEEGYPLGIGHSFTPVVDLAHCPSFDLYLSDSGEAPQAETWAATQVARYGADRVRIVRVPPGTPEPD